MKLTDAEKKIIKSHRAGHGIICNCNFGFMVRAIKQKDGRVEICCPDNPLPIRGVMEAEQVRLTIMAWTRRLNEYDASSLARSTEN